MLKVTYTIFVGVLFATLVGVGIAAFYKGPTPPQYKSAPRMEVAPDKQSPQEIKQQQLEQEKYDKEYQVFQKEEKLYNRNVSIVSLLAALLAMIISLTLFKTIAMIADGVLLGGVLTLLYSIVRGFAAEDDMFRFAVVAIGFVTALTLGYLKFVPKDKKK